MNNEFDNAENILKNIVGFHTYILSDPLRLSFVSDSFCRMTGISREELTGGGRDGFAAFVHVDDREKYSAFLNCLSGAEQTLTLQCRIVRKSGTVMYISNTAVSKKLEDGTVAAYCVLSDITDIKKENNDLYYLNETVPCGFLKYTCEKQPKVTYINKQMRDIMRLPDENGEGDLLEMYRDNIFLFIPIEERRRFALYLNRVFSAGVPMAGEMTVIRCDGTRAHLFGWVTKCVGADGKTEFQSACMDMTERFRVKKAREEKRYLKALSDVYDKIFEYDLSANTVKCLFSNNSPMFKWTENIPMQMEEATERWISKAVLESDRDAVRKYFYTFFQKKLNISGIKPPQITFGAYSSSGQIKHYNAVILKLDDSVSLCCCRRSSEEAETDALKSENSFLKENMQDLVMRFTDGIAAFEVLDDMITPLYSSDNVCGFFGFSGEEWIQLMKKSTPVREFTARSSLSYENFTELRKNGEAEFTYFDLNTGSHRKIKAICSRRSADASAPMYIMLYNIDGGRAAENSPAASETAVSIRTFGYFDVFVGGKPIAFRNKKSKELFALLVDRRGGYISSEEAISFLWEDETVNSVTLARYRKVALRLKNILEEYGISDVVESVDGKRRIVTEKVRCDLYDYLSGKEEYAQLFKGSYLTNYSWGENTLAELTGDILH